MRRLLIIALMVGMVVADDIIRQEGYCVVRGECGKNPTLEDGEDRDNIPCVRNEPVINITLFENPSFYTLLSEVCPHLINHESAVTSVCCDLSQLTTLSTSIGATDILFNRCPSCVANMHTLFCHSTCSPNQSQFLNVTSSIQQEGYDYESALAYTSTNWQDYADATYDSCKDVVFPQTNDKVVGLMCGGYNAEDCTSQSWLNYLGSTNNGVAPLDIFYTLVYNTTFSSNPEAIPYSEVPHDIIPQYPYVVPCHENATDTDPACSCSDCETACPAPPPIPASPEPFLIQGKYGVAYITAWVFVVLCLGFFGFLFVKCRRDGKKPVMDFRIPKAEKILQEDNVSDSAQECIEANAGRPLVRHSDIGCTEKLGKSSNDWFTKIFEIHGRFIATYPISTIIVSVIVVGALCSGIPRVELTTDPIALWSTEGSKVRNEKDYYDTHFTPFYRTEQVIMTLKDELWENGGETYVSYTGLQYEFSEILKKKYLFEALDYQNSIRYLKAPFEEGYLDETTGEVRYYVTLQDICLKPLEPDNNNCTIMSTVNYWQNDPNEINKVVYYYDIYSDVNYTVDYHDHFLHCVQSPSAIQDTTPLLQKCLSDADSPVFPYLAVGGYGDDDQYHEAEAHIISFVVNNFERDSLMYRVAMAWEAEFIRLTHAWDPESFTYAFFSERSIEDEIVRSSESDIVIFIIAYSVIFLYIMFALGTYSTLRHFPVDVKITLALCGIIIILGSVFAALGLLGYFGVASSLIVIEVVPFLVLAIGADNVFILTLEYQRDDRREGETRAEQIGRAVGQVAPSMLLCSLTESTAFFLGCLSDMPAVRQFALCSALAILIDFFLQITAFVAILALDSRREEASRSDVFCCIKLPKGRKPESVYEKFFKNSYTPFLMKDIVRITVIIAFIALFCGCVILTSNMTVGLDQTLSVPKDSYVLDYFDYMEKYLQVGVPVYFVTKGPYNFSNPESGKYVCGSAGCDVYSLVQQISYASETPDYWKIETPASSWYDDYVDWLQPYGVGGSDSCCRYNRSDPEDFCPSSDRESNCQSCLQSSNLGGETLYTSDEFMEFLPWFLIDNPGIYCSKGGHAAYGDGVDIVEVENNKTVVEASYFMAYHSICIESVDCTRNMEMGYLLAENITQVMRQSEDHPDDFEVFPYCLYYVYYYQYLTMVRETIIQISLCLIPTFLYNYVLLGFDLYSGLITVFTIFMIVVDTAGLCSVWEVDLNAISLINLVAGIGLSVEFTSHVVRAFALNTCPTRKERVIDSMTTMGPAVFAGVALTNLPGICVLAFATAQLIQVFFFRMCLVVTLLGMAHGLIFLPVFLSYFGPPVNKAILYEKQQKLREASGGTAEDVGYKKNEDGVYINVGYRSDTDLKNSDSVQETVDQQQREDKYTKL